MASRQTWDPNRNYYRVLGVKEGASHDEIKVAFRRLAVKHHPDITEGSDSKFKEINEAYQVLGDIQTRAMYEQARGYTTSSPIVNQERRPRTGGNSSLNPNLMRDARRSRGGAWRAFEVLIAPRTLMYALPVFAIAVILSGTDKRESSSNRADSKWSIPRDVDVDSLSYRRKRRGKNEKNK